MGSWTDPAGGYFVSFDALPGLAARIIERAAAVYPDQPALVHGNERRTWAETYARCRRLASALSRRGIGTGDTVAVMAPNVPAIFEATFEHDGILVRADVLIPDGNCWRLVEVKASTSVKDYHVLDCAIQEWVLRNAGIPVKSIALAHINNQFVYEGDGNYDGLLVEEDLSDRIAHVDPRVEDLIARAREALSAGMPRVTVGAHCSKPYDCAFQNHY